MIFLAGISKRDGLQRTLTHSLWHFWLYFRYNANISTWTVYVHIQLTFSGRWLSDIFNVFYASISVIKVQWDVRSAIHPPPIYRSGRFPAPDVLTEVILGATLCRRLTTKIVKRGFHFCASTVWSSFASELRSSDSLSIRKRRLKTTLNSVLIATMISYTSLVIKRPWI